MQVVSEAMLIRTRAWEVQHLGTKQAWVQSAIESHDFEVHKGPLRERIGYSDTRCGGAGIETGLPPDGMPFSRGVSGLSVFTQCLAVAYEVTEEARCGLFWMKVPLL